MTKQTSDYHGSKMMKTNQTTSLVVAAVLLQALSLPMMAEEIHGEQTFTNLSLGDDTVTNPGWTNPPFANTSVGANALNPLTAFNNSAFGAYALGNNTSGIENTAHGAHALRENTTGSYNTAVGTSSLGDNVSGQFNTAIGDGSLTKNTSGGSNVAIGGSALQQNTSGYDNVAIGHLALMSNVSGIKNVAVGRGALIGLTIGYGNTVIGHYAGNNQLGNFNVFIGHQAGFLLAEKDANNQLIIANGMNPENELITGDFAQKTIDLNGSVTVKNHLDVKGELRAFQSLRVNKNIYTNGHLKVKKTATAQSFNTTSDARLKDDIQPLNDALSSVLQLQGKTYRWKEDHHKQDIGLIAQEVEQVFPELVEEDANGFKAIAYSRLTAVLIEAIKEQQGQMTTQQDQITALEKENTQLKAIMAEQMDALLARVAMLEGAPLVAN
jgi:hypothetical protein